MATFVSLGAALAVCPWTAWGQPSLTRIGSFQSPVYVAAPPGDSHRLMVVERAGRVRLVKNGTVSPTPFLDISSSVDAHSAGGGLLSIAFPPNYAKSGRFYAYYTDSTGIRVAEFRASTPDRANASTRRIVLSQAHSTARDHYAGQLQFDANGLLYISIGDGGDGGGNAQNLGSWWGKILRINPLASGTAAYSIPSGNPVLGGTKSEVWSYGLRNPWRFSLDRQTGDAVIGDVGESALDEVDLAASGGANFGWNCLEGTQQYTPGGCTTNPADAVPPVLEKAHSSNPVGGWCGYSITGGYVVRNSQSSLNGRYVYGDYCTGVVSSAQLTNTSASGDTAILQLKLPELTLVSFGEDASGRLYVVSYAGPVYRIDG